MGGSKPEWADANDHATLEEVFTSRSFGHPLPKAPRRAVVQEPITASKLYFVRSRLVASGAVVAAALSVVAGLSIGAGPMAQSVLSASGPVASIGQHDDNGAERRRLCGPGEHGPRRNGQPVRRDRAGVRPKRFVRPGGMPSSPAADTTGRERHADRHADRGRDGLPAPAAGGTGTSTRRQRRPRPRRRPARPRRPRRPPRRRFQCRRPPAAPPRSVEAAARAVAAQVARAPARRVRLATPATPARRAHGIGRHRQHRRTHRQLELGWHWHRRGQPRERRRPWWTGHGDGGGCTHHWAVLRKALPLNGRLGADPCQMSARTHGARAPGW